MHLSLQQIRQAVVGEGLPLDTAFGRKPLIYADYTASGRSLDFVERFIQQQVLPYYANTHTETSLTGRQSTALREQARGQIRRALNVPESHSVVFCGSGATAAIDKLMRMLNLSLPKELDALYQFEAQIPEEQRPVVFIGPYEHHSNELPWRESIAIVERIRLSEDGLFDLEHLRQALRQYAKHPLLLGSFSAASNVTGIKTNVRQVTELLHEFGAYALWDYAAAGPYVGIDVAGCDLDAVFLSPHKFVGGPDTPGVLVVNNALCQNRVPSVCGGGTVLYVTPEDHQYLEHAERREEGGTPSIVGAVRAGLAFHVQQAVGIEVIEAQEKQWIERALARWRQHPNISLLGNLDCERLSIASFEIRALGKALHYSFVVALLNDLFGIQARGGCSCAGPYGHALLALEMPKSRAIEAQLLQGNTLFRPGWTRMNFNYFIDEDTFDYLLSAVELIADHGWRLLPAYQYDAQRGVWLYAGRCSELPVQLADCLRDKPAPEPQSWDFKQLLQTAKATLLDSPAAPTAGLSLPTHDEQIRWFLTPEEASAAL